MGFRNPARAITPTALNTGGTAPVVITATGGMEGGGAVLLYPNTTTDPAALEAGNGSTGPVVTLSSPPNELGARTQLLLAGADAHLFPGAEGVILSAVGKVYTTAGWRHFDGTAGVTIMPGWNADAGGPITVRKDGAGNVHLRGILRRSTGGAAATPPVQVLALPAGYRPATTHGFVMWSSQGAMRIDVESGGAVRHVTGGTTGLTGGQYMFMQATYTADEME